MKNQDALLVDAMAVGKSGNHFPGSVIQPRMGELQPHVTIGLELS